MANNTNEIDEQELAEMEEIRLEWLASAKRRNLAPYIIDILSHSTTLEDLYDTRDMCRRIDQEAAAHGMHRFEYLAQVSEEMKDMTIRMFKAELAHKAAAK